MRTAVIVAGGRSTRFGDADKAVAELAGTPMVRRVASRLAGVCDAVVVNGRADQRAAIEEALDGLRIEWRYAVDTDPDRGPVAGIRAGLAAAADSEYAAVVACDMPFVAPAFVDYLFERAAGGVDGRSYEAVVPRPDEWLQPLQAVYAVEPTVAACDAVLDDGGGRILRVVDRLDALVVDGEDLTAHADPTTFENVNTRAELRAAAARLEAAEE